MLILEAWELFEKDKKLLNYSPHTLKAYKLQCQLLARELNNCPITDVTYQQLKEYLYKQTHLKPASLGHRIRFIRSFFRWASDEGHINKNPAVRLREPKEDKPLPKFLTEEEIEYLRAACETPFERALVEFLYTTGCRIGEVVKLDREDIDWYSLSVIVDGKGSVQREVYFNTICKIWLKKYFEWRKDNCPALFSTLNRPHRRMSIARMREKLKEVSKRAGLKNVYPHRLRHSFGTHLLNNGAPMEAIRQLLGHSKLETTTIYAHLSTRKRKAMYNRYF